MTQRTVPRSWREAWDSIKDEKVGDLLGKFKEYAENVRDGADPIEAMSGHLCGPRCWHWPTMSDEQKAKLKKAPWNQEKP